MIIGTQFSEMFNRQTVAVVACEKKFNEFSFACWQFVIQTEKIVHLGAIVETIDGKKYSTHIPAVRVGGYHTVIPAR